MAIDQNAAVSLTDKSAASTRLTSLDGLRGLAAVVVVFHHLSLTFPAIADVYLAPGDGPQPPGSLVWWITAGPAQLLIAGPEAVLVFFVLSGMVVSLPVLNQRAFSWFAYFPRRIVRLYLPIIASVLLAAVWILVSHQSSPSPSRWVSGSSIGSLGGQRVLSAMDVLFGDTTMNNPLWSLRWEVVFSLALPVFVLLALIVGKRRWWWAAILACVPVVFVGQYSGNGSLTYLPVFLVGTILAVKMESTFAWVARPAVARWAALGGGVVVVISLGLLNLHWEIWGVRPNFQLARTMAGSLEFLGAMGLVISAAFWKPAVKLLSTGLFRWLGRISFSLYLVHVPIIIALSHLFGPGHSVLVIVVAILSSFIVAELFSRFVELPAHRLARKIGKSTDRYLSLRSAHQDGPASCGSRRPSGTGESGPPPR